MADAFSQFEFVEVPKGRRRWLAPVIVVVVLLGLVVVAFFVVDGFARSYASNLVEGKVRSALSLPASTPVDVTIGGTSVLFQLVAGTFDRVDVKVDDLAVGDLHGDAQLTVTGVPVDQSKPIAGARLVFSAGQDDLRKMLSSLTGLPGSSAVITGGDVQLGKTFTVLGVDLPVGIAFTPSAEDGEVLLTPKSVELNGTATTPADLPPVMGGLFATQKVCVASLLPKDFLLDSLAVDGKDVVMTVTASSVTLNSALLSTRGTCPAA